MHPLHHQFVHRSSLRFHVRLALLSQQQRRSRLTIPAITFTLDDYSDADCIEKFRFTKASLRRLSACLRIPSRVVTTERTSCSGVEALCVLLRRFAVPDRWSDLISMFGRSQSGMCNIFLHVLDHIHNEFDEIIFLDRDRISAQLVEYINAIIAKEPFVSAADRVVMNVSEPISMDINDAMSSKFQSLVTPDGIISHAFGPIEGRRHHLTILRQSNLENVLADDDRFAGFVVYGDPAYGYSNHLASPFGGARLTDAQRVVNKSMSRVRISVEWSFGQVVQYWPNVDYKKKMRIGNSPIAKMYKVAVLLTNCITCDREAYLHAVI
ncbi:hypothetical protein H257_09853 [Aphanomyces astaci]|uniref:DDE Tnp4 domain-containing protein n=1 Tax=Aphanomyces astaci TaxID=112090 RepID=W4G9Z3_APHAT|nr:hypothetical protein H257_09853 [Aphanomyces astaci]ETV75884.1 hypothetical protein H257_09853 [Aphanomyces astaci]|eukprot:XP_009834526.1 hypothetical protein H257_09853 [Aphanomyces astaci]